MIDCVGYWIFCVVWKVAIIGIVTLDVWVWVGNYYYSYNFKYWHIIIYEYFVSNCYEVF